MTTTDSGDAATAGTTHEDADVVVDYCAGAIGVAVAAAAAIVADGVDFADGCWEHVDMLRIQNLPCPSRPGKIP